MGAVVHLDVGGRLGTGSRIDVSTEPPRVLAVEYELSPWLRDDLLACGPVVLVSEPIARLMEQAGMRGFDLLAASILHSEEPDEVDELPPNPPEAYRWVRTSDVQDPDLRITPSGALVLSQRLVQLLEDAGVELEFAEPDEPVEYPTEGWPAVPWTVIHGTSDDDGLAALPTVDATMQAPGHETTQFATVSEAVAWARAQTTRVLVHIGSESFSAGAERFGNFESLSDDTLRRADEDAIAHRQQGLAETMVHAGPREWYLAIVAPTTTLSLDEAERRVRALPAVGEIARHETAGGDPLWLITTTATSTDHIDRLTSDVLGAATTPDRYDHLQDGDTVGCSVGRGLRSGLLEHLDLEALLAGWVGRMSPDR